MPKSRRPTNPALWKRVTNKMRASSDGGKAGRWSAKKAARAQLEYRQGGGKWKQTTVPKPSKS